MSNWKKKENQFCLELWSLDDSLYVVLRKNGYWDWYYSYSYYLNTSNFLTHSSGYSSREEAMSKAIKGMKEYLNSLKRDSENINKEINKIENLLKDVDGG